MYPVVKNRALARAHAHVFRWRPWVELKLWRRAWTRVVYGMVAAWRFAFRAEILRLEGPGRRPLRRHEFEKHEVVQAHRGRWI